MGGSKEEDIPSSPLYERIVVKRPIHRFLDIIIISLLVCFLIYRVKSLVDKDEQKHGLAWVLGFLCESWFTLVWLLTVNSKWTPVEHITHPEKLSQWGDEIPPVDVFVTTADPLLEPPIITVNTVISVLALDYPPQKLSCYVSDDGCSSHTYYALAEASKFANLWVPFCRKYGVQVRAPFMYFTASSSSSSTTTTTTTGSDQHNSLKFKQEWKNMKDEYEKLIRKIEDFPIKSMSSEVSGDMAAFFSDVEPRNHPSIVKVIWENKGCENGDALPNLIYISREKRPKYLHHYKAGAMNVLTRVSGVMTNAPLMLNLDCDMFVNNPHIVRHALCLLLGSQFQENEEFGFVQCHQNFYDAPDGHSFNVLQKYLGQGFGGIQGALYGGTGCFHRRKIIYGLSPPTDCKDSRDDLAEEKLIGIFGSSEELIKSAADALRGMTGSTPRRPLADLTEAAVGVGQCSYENGTGWGTQVGWQYGSVVEDMLTGSWIHSKGWRSAYCTPSPPPFLGCSPHGGPDVMTQQKRWATGLLEVLLSRKSPIVAYFTAKMQLRQCLAYTTVLIWGIRSIPELCYALLPAYSIVTNSKFLPKVGEPAMYIYVTLFLIYNLYTLLEYLETRISVKIWLVSQMMSRIVSINAFLFGVFNAVIKIIGVSDTVFDITQKSPYNSGDGGGDGDDDDDGKLTFDGSLVFLPGTTLVLVQLGALIMGLFGLRRPAKDGEGSGAEEMAGCAMVVLCFWPFVQGLFRKGKYGIPFPTIVKSTLLAMLFAHLSIRT